MAVIMVLVAPLVEAVALVVAEAQRGIVLGGIVLGGSS